MGVDGGVLQSIAHSTCSGKRAVRALTYAFRRHWRRRIEHTWTNDISNGALLLVQGGGIMSRYLLVFAVLVAIANIALNYLAARIAATAVGWQSMFSTPRFALMFVVGLASLVFMSTLYFLEKSSIGMANGVLLMGVTSIMGGTLIGYFIAGSRVHWSEWVILGLILIFLLVRHLFTTLSI